MRKKSLGGDPGVWTNEEVSQYDMMQSIFIPKKDEMLDVIVSMIPFSETRAFKVMEIGVGLGALTERMLKRFPEADFLCLDGSDEMISNARVRLAGSDKKIKFLKINFNNSGWLENINNKFDLICSSLTLHYLATRRRENFFKEAFGLLKKNGMLIYSSGVTANSPSVQKIYFKIHKEYLKTKILKVMGKKFSDEDLDREFKKREAMLGINLITCEKHLDYLRRAKFSKTEFIWKHEHYAIFMGVK